VQSVELPLIKCAKSDGSYDIGVVIPTNTAWTQTSTTNNVWISTNPVLPDTTISTGGEPTAIVDVLYQGQVFRRATSLADFQNNSPSVPHLAVPPGQVYDTPGSFYIYGSDDPVNSGKVALTLPLDVPTPEQLSFFVTYQVFNEGGAKDVTVSPTEYLAPGTITINYVTATG